MNEFMFYSSLEYTDISQVRNAIQRAYEPVQIYFFTQLADWMGCRSFWDIGANIGSYSMTMAQLESVERVHSFEPMPTLYKELVANALKNDPPRKITPHQIAVSEKSGSVEFAILGNDSGANGIVDTLLHDRTSIIEKITVDARSLDNVVLDGSLPPDGPCFLKIDVEGHELSVLIGASEFLKNDCVLQIEVYEQETARSPVDAFLVERGYRRFWQIGADRYYARADRCPSNDQLLEIVSRAHLAMIADFRKIGIPGLNEGSTAITRRVGPIQVSLFDPVAGWLRRLVRRG